VTSAPGWGKLALTLIEKHKGKSVRVSYKPGRHQAIAESTFMRKRGQGVSPDKIPEAEAREMVDILWDAPEAEVLAIGPVRDYPWEDDFGEIMGLAPCDGCGELVSRVYLRVVGEKRMCIPCSGYER